MEKNKFVKNEMATCPVCGGDSLDYLDDDNYGDAVVYYWECADCHATGQEVYELRFVGHEEVLTASELDEENDEEEENE